MILDDGKKTHFWSVDWFFRDKVKQKSRNHKHEICKYFNDNGSNFFSCTILYLLPIVVRIFEWFFCKNQTKMRPGTHTEKTRRHIHLFAVFVVLPKPKILNRFPMFLCSIFPRCVCISMIPVFVCIQSFMTKIFFNAIVRIERMEPGRYGFFFLFFFWCHPTCLMRSAIKWIAWYIWMRTLFISMPHLLWCVECW